MMTEKEIEHFYQSVGEQIRICRQKRKMKQEALAFELNLSRASIVNIEKGRQRPSLHLLCDMAQIFQINIKELVPSYQHEKKAINPAWKKQVKQSTKGNKSSQMKLTNFLEELTYDPI